MTSPRSDLAGSSRTALQHAHGQVIPDGWVRAFPSGGSGSFEGRPIHHSGFLSRSVREAGDGPIARFVTRRNRWRWSPLRAALRELARTT